MEQYERLAMRVPAARAALAPSTDRTAPVHANVQRDGQRVGSRPVSGQELITAALDNMNAKYLVDGGEVCGVWANGFFAFTQLDVDEGDDMVIQVYGIWERVLPAERYADAALFMNEWNAENAWPKAYAMAEDDGRSVGIFGETTVNFGPDLTPAQVEILINYGISTALDLFDTAESRFPDARSIDNDTKGSSTHENIR